MRKLRKALRKEARKDKPKEKSIWPKARKISHKKMKGNYDLSVF